MYNSKIMDCYGPLENLLPIRSGPTGLSLKIIVLRYYWLNAIHSRIDLSLLGKRFDLNFNLKPIFEVN